ncbi:MAG: hypothetical protein GF410_18300 [Chitinivibrionales bacterium]|nr:hypothetical protein [Chitinivibrionales bacterium]
MMMLIRISPEMIRDPKYECATVQAVRREVFGTRKFKDKYPWRTDFKAHLKAVSPSKLDPLVLDVVKQVSEEHINASEDNAPFRLSPEDKEVAAFAASNGWEVGTGDKGLQDFLDQEFDIKSHSALEVLNIWLKKKVIAWTQEMDKVLREWAEQREKPQPQDAKKLFAKLTGKKYPGP